MSNITKKTCSQFFCGGQNCDALQCLFSKTTCQAILRLFVSILIFSIFGGIMYLYLVPFSNFVSMKLFDDSVCYNYPWSSCSSILLDKDGYTANDAFGWVTFFGFLVSFSVFAPIVFFMAWFVWNLLMDILVLDDLKVKKLSSILFPIGIGCLSWIWFFLCINCGLFFAKKFSAAAYGCDFKHIPTTTPFGYAIGRYDAPHHLKWTSYSGMCAPIKYLGFNKGVQIDDSINTDGCNDCVNKGFWTIFLGGIAIVLLPLLVFIIVKCVIRRWNSSKNAVLNQTENDRLLAF